METLLSNLASRVRGPVELILYIGAGSYVAPSDYAALNSRQLILVEGDPEAAERLAQSLAGEASCQVVSALVTPNGARSRFFRYNLPFLNGTLALGESSALYPRLKTVEELELSSQSLSTVLKSIPLSGPGERLLIVDIPGQEAALLESVSPEQLHAFDWILVRGCKRALQEAAQSVEETIKRLAARSWQSIATDEETDPEWPLTLLHFDRRLADLHREIEARARVLVEKTTEIRQQADHILNLEAQLNRSQAELDLARQQSKQEAGRVAELDARLNASHAELVLARQQLGEANQRIHDIEAAKTMALQQAAEREAAALAERDSLAAQLGSARERAAALENELAAQKTLVEVLGKGRSQQDKLYQQLAHERDGLRGEVDALSRRVLEMEGLLSSKETRGRLIDAEFQKVEGQIDLIKEIFLRENT